jgi:hypothetical protein
VIDSDLRETLHAHAATIEPIPRLAELGSGLTVVERHRRARAVVSTTIVAFAVAAAVTAVRAVDTHPNRIDTAPATQRVVIAPAPRVTPTTLPATVTTVPAVTVPVAPGPAAAQPVTTVPPPPAPTAPAPTNPTTPATAGGPTRVLTFRAASVSDLSAADPPAADYFGVAPPGSTVTATSPFGTASTLAGADGQWSLHLPLPGAPLDQRFRVVLSAPPLPSLTFNFTHTTD